MRQFFGDRAQVLCLGLWLLSLLPAIHQLSWVHQLLCLVPLALHPQMRQRSRPRGLIMGLVLAIAIGWVALNGQRWLSAPTIISLLAIILLLKWAESITSRELRISALASIILATLSSLYLSGLFALTYLICCGILMLLCLLSINDSEHQLSSGQLLKTTLNLSILALPVTVLLFVTVPRIQGPLWDIGLALGLPIELAIDQDARDIGLKATLKAGQISRLKRSDAPVLVAEFSGAVPYKSRLYWRGPVFSEYDGISWHLPDNWDNRSRLLHKALRGPNAINNVLTSKRDRVHYEARVSPHSGRWLYALDLPSGQTPEAFISSDFQLLGIRTISREFKYDVDAWLEYSGGSSLSAKQRAAYLKFPENSNPKLRAYGQQLAKASSEPQEILYQWRKALVSGGYQLTETTYIDSSRHNLDSFFFDHKAGSIEHIASSTALVLRAAGIPTRLISGYRGGSLIALTNFIVVKQEHAHIWVEIWTDTLGWQRIDAKDFVAPPTPEKRLTPSSSTVKSKVTQPQKNTAPSNSPTPATVKEPTHSIRNKNDQSTEKGWLSQLNSGLESWILNYNPDRQVELLKKSGLRQVDWKNLTALALLGLMLLAVIYGLLLQIGRQKQDPIRHSFEQLNGKMKTLQLACGEQECPSHWLQRIVKTHPPYYPALKQVVDQYLRLRYISNSQPHAEHIKQFQRDVKRLIAML